MKTFIRYALKQLLVLLVSASVAFAQTPPAQRSAAAAQPELDQMLAPIALYPDSLLSQIFMASTYPLEVVEAARWSRANPGLTGQQAVDAVGGKDWDASVKSLAAFPQVLAMMDQQIEWTARLGDVFIAQEPQVMETVQSLRQKAYEAGNLRSTEQAYVVQQGDAYAIEPASPEVVYVPYYDPRVAYGSWWWPAYPPVRTGQPVVWQHDPGHRRGVPYHIATVQQRFGGTQAGQRRDFRWQDPVVPATRNGSLNRPEVHDAHLRQNPRGPEDGRAGRRDGRSNFSPNPGVVRSDVRPEIGVSRPPVAPPVQTGPVVRNEVRPQLGVSRPPVVPAPQVHAGPGNVPRMQNPAPQPGAGRGQPGNHAAPSAPRAHGEGHR